MKSGQGAFDVDDFVSKLITFMGGRKPLDLPDEEAGDVEADDGDGDAPLGLGENWKEGFGEESKGTCLGFHASSFTFSVDFGPLCLCLLPLLRLGPLSRSRAEKSAPRSKKRAKLEKHKEDEKKPQEIREEDIARSENETTKNVAQVCPLFSSLGVIMLMVSSKCNPAHQTPRRNWHHQPLQIHSQP